MKVDVEGQVGIVTGAGSPVGIGRSIVLELARSGAAVIYACDINMGNMDDLIQTAKSSGCASVIKGQFLDVSDEQSTVNLLKQIVKEHGRFDFFFANAGIGSFR
jgi:3-oxoacyl-[acyl-carrier protein] reductase